jgi:hypothetical protein
VNDGARTRDNRNHNPDYNKKHSINQLVIRLPNLITNVNKSNKAMMILRTVAKSLHYLKTNLTTYDTKMEPLFFESFWGISLSPNKPQKFLNRKYLRLPQAG